MLPCAEGGDAAEAELFCLLNIFPKEELGFGAAASRITCGGIPGELEQMETSKIHWETDGRYLRTAVETKVIQAHLGVNLGHLLRSRCTCCSV